MTFEVKDSGERMQFESGMVRDTDDSKINYSLVLDGPMLKRWAVHLTKGAKKYAPRNWMLARGEAELNRFRESAVRHFIQWYNGDTDEDHGAAVIFNINGAEYVKEREGAREILVDRDPGDETSVGKKLIGSGEFPKGALGNGDSFVFTMTVDEEGKPVPEDPWTCRCPLLGNEECEGVPCCQSEIEDYECCCEQNK